MKNFTKKIIAAVAAAAITITAVSVSAFAAKNVSNGWVKEDGVSRRYHEGDPYTGWLKSKDGSRKYCLDGYLVTDEIQKGKYSYSFNEDGILTGKTPLAISAKVTEKITPDTETFNIKLTKIVADGRQSFGVPVLLERWEKGEWVDCFADLDGNVPMTMELYTLNYKGETLELPFRSLVSTGYKLTPGFYRIPINDVTDNSIIMANPVAVISDDGKTAVPISAVQSAKADNSADFVSTYVLFEVVAK